MEMQNHSLISLFDQLGLGSTDEEIKNFIRNNAPIDEEKALHEAKFWSPSQSHFLKRAKDEDADWSDIVDHLNIILRQPIQP